MRDDQLYKESLTQNMQGCAHAGERREKREGAYVCLCCMYVCLLGLYQHVYLHANLCTTKEGFSLFICSLTIYVF